MNIREYLLILLISVLTCAVNMNADAHEVTIEPANPEVNNCFPFGNGGADAGAPWTPFMGFIYKDVPPFELKAGDKLAFDLGKMNSTRVALDIELAVTGTNGSRYPGAPFTKVVSNTQWPENPRGDTIIGNFEMRFTAERDFNFPGGGLIIRFSNPSETYQLDKACDRVLVEGDFSDPSGNFVLRYYNDEDGLPPYTHEDVIGIGGFSITSVFQPVAAQIPTLSDWGMIAAAAGLGLAGFFAIRRRNLLGT